MAQSAYNNGSGYGSVEPSAKRPRNQGFDSSGYGSLTSSLGGNGAVMPTRVVRVTSLPPSVTEADLIDVFQSNWGPVSYIQFNSAKEADIEFENPESAHKCVSHCQTTPFYVLQCPVYAVFSPLQAIPRKRGESEQPSPVLYMQVLNPRFGIDVNVVNKICSSIAPISRISIQKASGGGVVEVLAEFSSPEVARSVKHKLNGCDIYSGCCTLKIEYSSMDHVTVSRNSDEQWDYTGKGSLAIDKSRPSLLQDPSALTQYPRPMAPAGPNKNPGGVAPPMPYGFPPAPEPYGFAPPGMPRFPPPPPFGHMPPPFPGMPPPPGAHFNGPPADGCGMGLPGGVLMLYGLCPGKMNCDRLFNLLCLYGNVQKIKFLKSKPDTAMVQMGDRTAATRAVEFLNRFSLFGQKLSVSLAKQDFLQELPNSVPLDDGTPSYKDFTTCRNNRYLTPENAAKNRLVEPSRNVYFFNAPPDITEEQLSSIFTDAGSTTPIIKIFPNKQAENARSTAGIAEFPNDEEALGGLVLANHTTVPGHGKYPYVIKMSFCGPPTPTTGGRGSAPVGYGSGFFPGPPQNGRGVFDPMGRGFAPPMMGGRGGPPFRPRGPAQESPGILWGSGGSESWRGRGTGPRMGREF